MTFPDIPTLKTPRLLLRKLTPEDAPDYFRHLFGSQAVSQYMLWAPHKELSESVASIQKVLRRYEEGRCYRWGIVLAETGSLVGIVELLRFDEEVQSCSFAYMLGEDFWGRGYGTEALTAAFDFAFLWMGVHSITADHFAENPASGRVMEKVGMQKTGIYPGKYVKNGISHDAIEYRITKEEWHKARH